MRIWISVILRFHWTVYMQPVINMRWIWSGKNGGTGNGHWMLDMCIQILCPVMLCFDKVKYPIQKNSLRNKARVQPTFDDEPPVLLLSESVKETALDTFEADLFIDGQLVETAKFPTNFKTRRHELFRNRTCRAEKQQLRSPSKIRIANLTCALVRLHCIR